MTRMQSPFERLGEIYGFYGHSSFSLSAVLIVIVCIVAVLAREALAEGTLWAVFVMTGSVLLCMLVTGIIWRQPESKTKLSFKVSRTVGDVLMGHRHFLLESWALVTGQSWECKLGDLGAQNALLSQSMSLETGAPLCPGPQLVGHTPRLQGPLIKRPDVMAFLGAGGD